MKLEFKILLKGNDYLKEKFEKSSQNNPNLAIDLARAFVQSVILALCLNENDQISIEGFSAGQVQDVPVPEIIENPS